MNDSRRKRYENALKAREQRLSQINFSKNHNGCLTIDVDLRKKSGSGLCLCMMIFMDFFYFLLGPTNPEKNSFSATNISILIGINVILLIFEIIIRFTSKGAIHYYIIDKENNQIMRKTKNLGRTIVKVYNMNEITHVLCKRVPGKGNTLFRIHINLTKKRKINFFHSFSKQNAIEISKNLCDYLETNCIYHQYGVADDWNEPYFFTK